MVTLATYAGCLIAVLSHLLLDWTNVYGVRLMLPFNAKWYRLDSTDIIDPVILGVLLLALAAPALSGLLTSEMGGRKSRGPQARLGLVRAAGGAVLRYRALDGARQGDLDRRRPQLPGRSGGTRSACFPCGLP